MSSKRKREEGSEEGGEKEVQKEEADAKKARSLPPPPDVKDYITSGRLEKDVAKFFPDQEKEVPEAGDWAFDEDKPLSTSTVVDHIKDPSTKAALIKLEELVHAGALPRDVEVFDYKSFGLDYVKHNVIKDQDGQWFVVFGYYENFYALKLATGAVHFWDSEGEASEEIFFKDLDTCAYVLLRACAGLEGEGQPDKAGSAVLDELLSFNQTASNELVEELRDTGNFDDEEGEGGEGGEEGGEEGDGDKDGDDEDEEEEEGDD